jgi:plasmid stabilization system protein ParE
VTYHVDWTPTAQNELAAIWNAAQDRAAVTAASDEIDRLLARDAPALGEARADNFRVYLHPPLGVDFQVFPAERRALVVRVWRVRRPARP